MDPEFFRHLIPGLIFWLPTILVLALGFEMPKDEGLTWATVIIAATPPAGWLIYQNFRALWLRAPIHGYERSLFVKMARSRMRFRWDPQVNVVLADFRDLDDQLGLRSFSWAEFRKLFHWRSLGHAAHFDMNESPRESSEFAGWSTLSLEPITDLILFADHSFDYARTISTVRYAYMTAVFALFNGIVFAWSLWSILSPLRSADQYGFTPAFRSALALISRWQLNEQQMAGLGLLGVWAVFGLWLGWTRFRLASGEYFARTAIITLRHSKVNAFVESDRPPDNAAFRAALTRVDSSREAETQRVALFDLDGTLLRGDIGEAVFAYMMTHRGFDLCPDINFSQYEKLKHEDVTLAYRMAAQVFQGCTPSTIWECAEAVLSMKTSHIEVEGFQIAVPRPDPRFQHLIRQLWLRGYRCVVVTASSQLAAEPACWRCFGIPSDDVIGVRLKVNRRWFKNVLSNSVIEPAPILAGKSEATLLRLSCAGADIGAGDSTNDRSLLSLVRPGGTVLWTGLESDISAIASALQPDVKIIEVTSFDT